MYPTPAGERVLQGAERGLFLESLAMLVDFLADGDFDVGIGPFDNLQRNQKIAVLHIVGHALLRLEAPAPRLTAILEAAVAAVYRHLADMIAMEITDPVSSPPPSWRRLVLEACRESEVLDELPKADSNEIEAWSLLLDCLEGMVLWDTDWGLESPLDAAPETTERVKRELGIDQDYYVAVPPDPPDSEAERLLADLRELTAAAR